MAGFGDPHMDTVDAVGLRLGIVGSRWHGDLVDHMIQMERSGRIDMDAFRGERNDDDEPGIFGDGAEED